MVSNTQRKGEQKKKRRRVAGDGFSSLFEYTTGHCWLCKRTIPNKYFFFLNNMHFVLKNIVPYPENLHLE